MAEINTSIWGEQEDWVDASFYYESYEAPLKDRIQWASYDGEHDNIYGFIHGAATLEPNTPIDNSISYCGLGTESPLSHITYFRGQQGYSYRFRDGNVPWTSAEANTQEEIIKDDRMRTNFALSYYTLEDGNKKNISKQYFATNRFNDYFHQGWGPSSVIDTITDTTSAAFKHNPTLHTKIPVRLPIKNMVAIPYVRALANVGVESPDPITVDLKTYLDTTSQYNYTNHPYMYQVYMTICSDPSGVKETGISRSVDPGFNQLMLLEDISMWKGMPSGTYELHEYGDVIDYTNIDYSHIISYEGHSGIPILGNLIGSWNKRYSGCEPKGDGESSDWDLHDLDWWVEDDYHGHGDAGNGGPECFAWAGPDPSIAWWEPNGSAYEKQANYKRFIYRQITNADEFLEEVRSAVACFGLFFVDGEEDKNVALDDNKMMLGILKSGVGHGDYSHGEANRDQDQWNMDDAHDVDYDPGSAPPQPGDDPDGSQDPIPVVPLTWTLATAGGGVWALTHEEINQVMNDIFGADVKPSMYGNNPMDAIISLEWTPFQWSGGTPTPIILGNTVVNQFHRYPILNSINYAEKHEEGQVMFNFAKHFYNARCMQARLWLPFYGYYPLPMAQLLSSRLKVEFYYDVPDVVGSWHISFDDIPYDHVECNPNIEIPLTGSNAAAIKANKANQAIAIGGEILNTVLDAALLYFGTKTIKGQINAANGRNAITGRASGTSHVDFTGGAASRPGSLTTTEINNNNFFGRMAYFNQVLNSAGQGAQNAQNIINRAYQGSIERAALRTNLPYHGTASTTTFLHLPMYPYVQIFKNTVFGNLKKTNGGTVKVELGGTDEEQYMLKVGHACDIFDTIDKMPENSLLQTTGLADNDIAGMEMEEFNELNEIIQSGFYR